MPHLLDGGVRPAIMAQELGHVLGGRAEDGMQGSAVYQIKDGSGTVVDGESVMLREVG